MFPYVFCWRRNGAGLGSHVAASSPALATLHSGLWQVCVRMSPLTKQLAPAKGDNACCWECKVGTHTRQHRCRWTTDVFDTREPVHTTRVLVVWTGFLGSKYHKNSFAAGALKKLNKLKKLTPGPFRRGGRGKDNERNKKLIRRWDSERELSLRRHRTRTTKYNRFVHKFCHTSTPSCVGTQVYQIQSNNAMAITPFKVIQGHRVW